jgi:hypothetical protein
MLRWDFSTATTEFTATGSLIMHRRPFMCGDGIITT